MAVFVLKALGIPPDTSGMQIYDDVLSNHPFYGFVQVFSTLGITAGCSNSPPLFCPDDLVTRAQMAVFLVKAFLIKPCP
jgi:hypothetical protein